MGSSISGMGFGGMPSAAQMSQMREKMFGKADANGDGSVDKAEFAKAGPQGADSKKTDEMFAKIDSDGNGKISKDESSAFDKKMSAQMQSMMLSMQNSGQASGMPDLSQLFGDKKDDDKTSSVSGSNSTQSKQDVKNRLDELFAKADSDKDGKLSKDELKSLGEQMQSQFKSSLLSAQEQAQKSGGSGNDNALFTQLFNNSSNSGSTGSTDPFTSLMMKQLQAV